MAYAYPQSPAATTRSASFTGGATPSTPSAAAAGGMPTYVVGGNQPFSIPIPSTPSGGGGGGGGAMPATPSTPHVAGTGRRRGAAAAGLDTQSQFTHSLSHSTQPAQPATRFRVRRGEERR